MSPAAVVEFMIEKAPLMLAAWFIVACSDDARDSANARCAATSALGGAAGVTGFSVAGTNTDERAIVPDHLQVSPRPGINSVFNVTALTLRAAERGIELYASVRNDGEIAACNPSFSVELRDRDEQVLAAGVSGLMIRRFYRLLNDATTIAGCVAPGDVTRVAITNLSLDAPLADVQSVIYQSNYWYLDVVAVPGVGLADVQAVTRSEGLAYTGTLVNGLELPLMHPTVAIFPLNAVGRPLDVAYAGSTLALAPCDTWKFETSAVSELGVGYDAYPMGGP